MEQAKQELKSLMNELFVQDIRNIAGQLHDDMASQFQGAVNDFSNEYQDLVNKAASTTIAPIIENHTNKITESFGKGNEIVNSELSRIQESLAHRFSELVSENEQLFEKINENSSKIADVKASLDNHATTSDKQLLEILNQLQEISSKGQTIDSNLKATSKTIIERTIENTHQENKTIREDILQSKAEITTKILDLGANSMKTIDSSGNKIIELLSKYDENNRLLREEIDQNNRSLTEKTDKLRKYSNALLMMVAFEMIILIVLLFK